MDFSRFARNWKKGSLQIGWISYTIIFMMTKVGTTTSIVPKNLPRKGGFHLAGLPNMEASGLCWIAPFLPRPEDIIESQGWMPLAYRCALLHFLSLELRSKRESISLEWQQPMSCGVSYGVNPTQAQTWQIFPLQQ